MILIEDKDKNNDTLNARNSKLKSRKKCVKISCSNVNKKSNKHKTSLKRRASKDKRKNSFKNKDRKR
jgi:hypothetical protein